MRDHWLELATLTVCAAMVGCAPPASPAADASPTDARAQDDAAAPEGDASAPADGAAAMDAAQREAGGACSFNRDCDASERCECDERAGCRCVVGPRGARAFGQPCTTGNDCQSALCVEGPAGFLCSDSCRTGADCSGALPRCVSVPTVGSFCARLPPDAGADAGAGADASVRSDAGTCSGPCATTALQGVFGSNRAGFDRAQHGRSGVDGMHIEAHFGGRLECPSMTSPMPDRTLVLSGIRATSDGRAQTYADGVRATLLDFRGVLTTAPLLRATDVRVTPRFVDRGVAVSFDVSATFPGGTITGGLFAPHCASLDE